MSRHARTLVLAIVLVAMGCTARRAGPAAALPAEDEAAVEDEAGELALLMRAMTAHADSVKAALASGAGLPPKPGFETLFTATPTPGMRIDPTTYPAFGQDYLAKLDALYAGGREDHPRLYNALVQSCANCHGTHCPGPLMRIGRMRMVPERE